jgi:putative SbcD/Mre11-related phosphoesterase
MEKEGLKILDGIFAVGKALWIKKQNVLVIADLHIGYEEELNSHGIFVPRLSFKEMKKEAEELIAKLKPRTIVINGDLKHEFGGISRQEWKETLEILDMLLKNCRKIVLIKGNHDDMLKPIAKKKGLDLREFYCVDNGRICIFHGEKIPLNSEVYKAKTLIIGHEHPSIILREGMKTEKYKCFLLGKWHGKKLIAMPSFFPFIEGLDIRNEVRISELLKQDISDFEVFIVGDKIYKFGKLRDI